MNKNVLVEQINSNFQVLPNKPANVLKRIKGVVSDNKSNRNGRIYPMSLWQNVVKSDYVKEMINNHSLFGEADHPETRLEISLQNVSHAINDLWIEGDKVMAVIDILPTPMGKILSELLDYGTNLGISSRGAGTVLADNSVDPDDYQFVTFDFVARPSCEAARMNTILESAAIEAKNTKDDEINNLLESYKSSLNEDEEIWKLDITVNGELNYSNKLSIKQVGEILEHAEGVKPLSKDFFGDEEEGIPFNREEIFDDCEKIKRTDKLTEGRVLDIVEVRKTLNDDDAEGLDMVLDYLSDHKVNLETDSLITIEDLVHDAVYHYNAGNAEPEYEGEEFYGREYNARNIYNAILKMYGRDKLIKEATIEPEAIYDKLNEYDVDMVGEGFMHMCNLGRVNSELMKAVLNFCRDANSEELFESIRDRHVSDTVKNLLS